MPTNINPLTPSATTGVVTLSSTGVASTVLPSGNNQVVGNDGAGNVAAVTLVAGANMSITQTVDQIEFVSTGGSGSSGAISWTAIPFNVGYGNYSTFPLTQTVTSLTSTLAYNGTDLGLEVTGSNTFASISTSTISFQSNISFATDAYLDNAPLTIVWAFYIANNFSVIATGALPFYTTTYLLPSTSSTVGTYNQYTMLSEMEYPLAAGNTDPIIAVPYLYVPAGSTLSGTNITEGTNFFASSYSQESNDYSAVTPITGNEYLMVGQVSLAAVNLDSLFAYGNINAAYTVIAQGEIVSFGEPSLIAFRLCVPIYISTSGSTATTVTVNIGLFVGGVLKQSIQTVYSVAGKSFIIDTIQYTISPNTFSSFALAQIGISYTTNNATTLQCSLFNPVTCLYDVYLEQYSTSIGSVAITDTQKQLRNIPATVSLPITVGDVFFNPGFGIFYEPLALSQVIDTFNLVTNFAQSQVELVFTLCFETDAYSASIASQYPCVYLQLGITSVNEVTQLISSVTQPVFSGAGNTVIGTAVCRGRVNVLSQSTQISALAGLIGVGGNSNITVTSFKAIAPGDATVFGGAGSNWDITVQSLTFGGGSSGGGGTTGGITDVVPVADSYLTASVAGTVVDIGTIQASSAQAGLITATTAFPTNSLVQIEASGSVPCEITSIDGSIAVTSSSGAIDLSASVPSSAIIDAYSPTSFSNVSLQSDVLITAPFTSTSPDLSVMDIVATGSVVCKYSDSVVQCDVCISCNVPNTQELGVQFALYASTLGSTAPVYVAPLIQQGAMTSSAYDNSSFVFLSFQVNGSNGADITYTVAGSCLTGSTVTVEASTFSMIVQEVLPNTGSIVASTQIPFFTLPIQVTEPYTSLSVPFSQTTPLINSSFTKKYSNSDIQVLGTILAVGDTPNQSWWGDYLIYFSSDSISSLTGSFSSLEAPAAYGSGGVTAVGGAGLGVSSNISMLGSSGNSLLGLASGKYNIAIGGTVQTGAASSTYTATSGYLIVNEIVPLASGGVINYEIFPSVITNTFIPKVSTTSPTYSQTINAQTHSFTTRASGSLCYIVLNVTSNALVRSGNGYYENQIQISVYTSTSGSALPIVSFRRSSPENPTGAPRNAYTSQYRYYFVSPAANTTTTYRFNASVMATLTGNASFYLSVEFFEVLTGNPLGAGLVSITADPASYLTSQIAGADATIGDIQASTTQAGLVALASATPANSLIQMGATVPVACTLTSSDSSVTITPSAGSIDLVAVTGVPTLTPNTISTAAGALVAGQPNIITFAGLCVATLPVTCAYGETVSISAAQGATFTIAQNANQQIRGAGNTISLLGTGGSATMNVDGGTVVLECVVADSFFNVVSTTDALTIV